jgi:hypothetical protein
MKIIKSIILLMMNLGILYFLISIIFQTIFLEKPANYRNNDPMSGMELLFSLVIGGFAVLVCTLIYLMNKRTYSNNKSDVNLINLWISVLNIVIGSFMLVTSLVSL